MKLATSLAVFVMLATTATFGGEAATAGAAEPVAAPAATPAPRPQTEGTRKMVARMKELADTSNVETNLFLNDERVARYRTLEPPDPTRETSRLKFDLMFGMELLNDGLVGEAVKVLEDVRTRVDANPDWQKTTIGREAYQMLAIAQMRRGEQENCVEHHGTDSCILPIRGTGIHSEQGGSRAAIREYTGILNRDPDDLGSRWLLNIAYMTVGEYPDKVPAKWLIPPSAFESDYDIKRFTDVASAAGVDVMGRAGAGIMEDFDGDRYLDIFVTSWNLRDPMRLFRNERDGTFSDHTVAAGLTGIVSGLNAVHADYDNDGDMDIWVQRGAWLREDGMLPPSLLRNRGDGSFDDVTFEAGVVSYRPSQAAAWGDYDNDGWVDLFSAPESSETGTPHPSELYHNNRDGTFTNVAAEVGVLALAFMKGAVWGDYDNDGLLDLYVSALENEPSNMLFHNDGSDGNGGWRFTEVGDKAGVRRPAFSFPSWFFDFDNDGWLDIFVSGYKGTVDAVAADYLGIGERQDGETPRLYRNLRNGTFKDVTREAGVETVLLTMGCNYGDLDNDGWMDFYAATGNPDYRTLVANRMFRNDGGRRFQDVTTSGGFGHLQKGHGVAFGDIDNDGDQDVFLKVGGAFIGDGFPSSLFENPGHGNRWITLQLVGVQTNRAAIGARIKVTVEEAGKTRDIYTTVSSGASFGGSTLRQEIGLGQATKIRSIEITWPTSGKRQVFENVAMEQFVEVREGDAELRPIVLDRLTLGGRPAPAPAATATNATGK